MYICNMQSCVYFIIIFTFDDFINVFLYWKSFWYCICTSNFWCRCGKKHFDVPFWQIRSVHQKTENTRSMKEEFGAKLFISCQSHCFIVTLTKILFPIFTLTWRVNNYVFCYGQGKNRRNESTIRSMIFSIVAISTLCQLNVSHCILSFFESLTFVLLQFVWNFTNFRRLLCQIFFCERWKHLERSDSWWQLTVSMVTQEHTRNRQSQNKFAPAITEEYITHVSEEIESRVTKELSFEFSGTKSRTLGALFKLDISFLNPQTWTVSGTILGTSRNNNVENCEPTEDRFQTDPHTEVQFCSCGTSNSTNYIPEDTSHMVAEVQEELPYWSPGTSSGIQKKARSKNQPKFQSANSSPTVEADQILLALQQYASNSNFANFNNKINRNLKLPKSLRTTTPTFAGNSEKSELFQYLLKKSLKVYKQPLEEDEKKFFHTSCVVMRCGRSETTAAQA